SAPHFDSELSTTALRCSADIWSLGILIYIMLWGSEPTLEELMAQVDRECEGLWSDVSASARHLITKMLQENPSRRLTAEEALRHPWVCGSTVATRHMLDAQERLRSFNARRKLRATTHAIIATQRAMSIVKPLRNCQAIR
ncbi:Calcium/calmodulin-dependent protein kinase type IV, partial [Homalodisca vitripennis]